MNMNDEEVRKRRYLRQIYFGEAMFESGGDTGLTFERGIWTPDADIADTYIYFNEQHDDAPFYYCIYNASDTFSDELNTNYLTSVLSYNAIDESRIWATRTIANYGVGTFIYRATSTSSITGSYSNMQSVALSTYLKSDSIRAYTNSESRYWRSSIEYRWLAVWAPEE